MTQSTNKALTLSSTVQSELYNAGRELAVAEAAFDFSLQGCAQAVIKQTKATPAKPVLYTEFDTVTRAIMAGFDGAKLDVKYAMSDAARKRRERLKSLLLSDFDIQIAAPVKSSNGDAVKKAEQREKQQAVKAATAETLQDYMAREQCPLEVATAELVARKSTAGERKQIRQGAAYIVEQQEAAHAERVKTAKGTIAAFMKDIKGNAASQEQLATLEKMAAVINS